MDIIRSRRSFPSTMTQNPKSPVSSHRPRRGMAQLEEQIPFRVPKGFPGSRTLWNPIHLQCYHASCTAFVRTPSHKHVDPWGQGKATEQKGSLHPQGWWDYMTVAQPYSRWENISVGVKKHHRYQPPGTGNPGTPSSCGLYEPPLCPQTARSERALAWSPNLMWDIICFICLPATGCCLDKKQHCIFFAQTGGSISLSIIITGERELLIHPALQSFLCKCFYCVSW